MEELKQKISKLSNLKLKLNDSPKHNLTQNDKTDLTISIRELGKDILRHMIDNKLEYPMMFKKSTSKETLQKIRCYDLNDYIKDTRKYKIRQYLYKRQDRDFNELREISKKLETHLG